MLNNKDAPESFFLIMESVENLLGGGINQKTTLPIQLVNTCVLQTLLSLERLEVLKIIATDHDDGESLHWFSWIRLPNNSRLIFVR